LWVVFLAQQRLQRIVSRCFLHGRCHIQFLLVLWILRLIGCCFILSLWLWGGFSPRPVVLYVCLGSASRGRGCGLGSVFLTDRLGCLSEDRTHPGPSFSHLLLGTLLSIAA
jgi:hypothetical protein